MSDIRNLGCYLTSINFFIFDNYITFNNIYKLICCQLPKKRRSKPSLEVSVELLRLGRASIVRGSSYSD